MVCLYTADKVPKDVNVMPELHYSYWEYMKMKYMTEPVHFHLIKT